jgi:regulator of extracellular matrix RemA (YlzA/DUF370 family)
VPDLARKGAGGCVIASHWRLEKRSRTVWITFQDRVTTSALQSATLAPQMLREGLADGTAAQGRSG